MKKFLILSAILIAFPAFATCPIEGGETVCSVPGFREQVAPIYQPKTGITEFSDTPEARLNSINRSDIRKQSESFAPQENSYSYNSNCQFGVCLQDRQAPLFQQPGK